MFTMNADEPLSQQIHFTDIPNFKNDHATIEAMPAMIRGLSRHHRGHWVRSRLKGRARESFPPKNFVTNKPTIIKPISTPPPAAETEPQRFDRVLSRAEFMPLKSVYDHVDMARTVTNAGFLTTN